MTVLPEDADYFDLLEELLHQSLTKGSAQVQYHGVVVTVEWPQTSNRADSTGRLDATGTPCVTVTPDRHTADPTGSIT